MRKQATLIAAAAALLGLLSVSASAQVQNGTMKFQVPFDFQIGERTMPAGEYLVSFPGREAGAPTVLIKSGDGRAARILHMTPVEAKRARALGTLVFNR